LNFIHSHYGELLAHCPSPFSGLDLPLVVKILHEMEAIDVPTYQRVANTKRLGRAIVKWAQESCTVADLPELITMINAELARNKIQIFVKTSKNTLVVSTDDNKSVCDLKKIIEGKEAIPVAFQLLMYNGKVLRDDRSLHECGIQNDSTVHLCIRSNSTAGWAYHSPSMTGISEESNIDLWKVLLNFCLQAVVADFEEQCRVKGFLKLDAGTLAYILQHDDLGVSHERIVLDALVRWIESKPELAHDTHVISRLLPLVRFPYIDTQSLLNLPLSHPVVTSCPAFKHLLQEALHFQISSSNSTINNINMNNNMVQTRRTSALTYNVTPNSPTNNKRPLILDNSGTSPPCSSSETLVRTKRRKLYNDSPNVNLDQFFSYVVSTLVSQPR
jgi:hypothetical protein